jgi:hypothetical protein
MFFLGGALTVYVFATQGGSKHTVNIKIRYPYLVRDDYYISLLR